MQIFLSHSSKYDYVNELYNPIKESSLDKIHKFIYFCEDPNYKEKSSKEIIQESDLIIADISIQSIGVGMEIGWASAQNKPIIMIHRTGVEVRGYMRLHAKDIFEYSSTTELIQKLERAINSIDS